MKVYVLVKTERITVNYGFKRTHYDYLDVLGVYSELESLENKLKQLDFIKEDIEYLIKSKWLLTKDYCYFLEEKEINQEV